MSAWHRLQDGHRAERRRWQLFPHLAAVLVCCLVLGFALASPPRAYAHPLGNFTVNRYCRVELDPDRVRLRYVVDMAEIPTFQAMPALDADGDSTAASHELLRYAQREATAVASGLVLAINGSRLTLGVSDAQAELTPGQAGLQTLRIALWLDAGGLEAYRATIQGGEALRLSLRDNNGAANIGWREIVVRAQGLSVAGAAGQAVPERDVSDELRAYPDALLDTPLEVRSLDVAVAPSARAAAAVRPESASPNSAAQLFSSVRGLLAQAAARGSGTTSVVRAGDVAALVTAGNLSAGVILLALTTAVFLGGLHALSPGHGKTIVGAYLIGSRGTVRHALFLGLVVTVVHTAGVYVLLGMTLFLSEYVLPERVFPWMSLASGALVLWIGATLMHRRLRDTHWGDGTSGYTSHARAEYRHDHGDDHSHVRGHDHSHEYGPEQGHDHDHGHGHSHGHSHAGGQDRGVGAGAHDHGFGSHSHVVPGRSGEPITWRSLIVLGVSGGLLPCPSAMVLGLGAIALNRVLYGLVLIAFFSVGLAGALVCVGLLVLYSGRLASRLDGGVQALHHARQRWPVVTPLLSFAPAVSAAVITIAGLGLTLEALLQLGASIA